MTAIVDGERCKFGKPGQYSYKKGCRCTECRAINSEKSRKGREKRFALRELIDGRWVAVTVPKERHGLVSTYNNWGCQCVPCSAAQAAANSAYQSGLKDVKLS